MAIFHCSIQMISRSKARSAVSSSSYRSGKKMIDQETGMTCDYTKRKDVVYEDVILCKNAPAEYQDREILWNAVQKIEKQSNAQLAREINVALPIELDRKTQIQILQNYVKEQFVSQGMCADIAIHDKKDGNPHAHIMLTTRPILANGKWGQKEKKEYARDEQGNKIPLLDENGKQKVRIRKGKGEEKLWQRVTVQANNWNDQGNAEIWRKAWADACNKHLDQQHQIDHRSYVRQGIEQIPTIHEGAAARAMEKRGEVSDRCAINREIKARNQKLQQIAILMENLQHKIDEITQIIQQKGRELHDRIGQLLQRRRTWTAARPDGEDAERAGNDAAGEQQTKARESETAAGTPAGRAHAGQDTAAFIRQLHAQIRAAEDERKAREDEQRRQNLEREREAAERTAERAAEHEAAAKRGSIQDNRSHESKKANRGHGR